MRWYEQLQFNISQILSQCRVPGGVSEGGQFASCDGVKVTSIASVSRKELMEWPDGPRRIMALDARKIMTTASKTAIEKHKYGGFALREGGQVKGIVAYDQYANLVANPGGKSLWVESLATKERGYGHKMMQHVCKEAVKRGTNGVRLNATSGAIKFYERIGMKRRPGSSVMIFNKEQTAKFAEEGYHG